MTTQTTTAHLTLHRFARVMLACGLGLACAVGFVFAANATPSALITVTTPDDELNDDNDCSLREAIQAANTDSAVDACVPGAGADTILIPAGIYTLTIEGMYEDANATGDIDITDPAGLTLSGAGADNTVLDANGLDRVLHALTGTLTLSGVTIQTEA